MILIGCQYFIANKLQISGKKVDNGNRVWLYICMTAYEIQIKKRMNLETQEKVLSFVCVASAWAAFFTVVVNWEIVLYYIAWIRGVKEIIILTAIILYERWRCPEKSN